MHLEKARHASLAPPPAVPSATAGLSPLLAAAAVTAAAPT